MKEETEKMFSYMDMIYFNQSLQMVIKLCESLKVPELAQKVMRYLSDKETKDLFKQSKSQKAMTTTAALMTNSVNIQEKRVLVTPISLIDQFKNEKQNDLEIIKPNTEH